MRSQTPEEEDGLIRAGEYALGLMTPAQAEAFEAEMARSETLKSAYVQWSEDFARLSDEISPVDPPARVKARLEALLFEDTPRKARWWQGARGWGAGLAAAALLLALFFVADVARIGGADVALVAQVQAEDGALVISASYSEDGALALERRAGAARAGRVLELWLIEGDNPPVSLGVLPETREARVVVPEALRASLQGGVLAVSDEPQGGSPTGAPTGDVLAVGALQDA